MSVSSVTCEMSCFQSRLVDALPPLPQPPPWPTQHRVRTNHLLPPRRLFPRPLSSNVKTAGARGDHCRSFSAVPSSSGFATMGRFASFCSPRRSRFSAAVDYVGLTKETKQTSVRRCHAASYAASPPSSTKKRPSAGSDMEVGAYSFALTYADCSRTLVLWWRNRKRPRRGDPLVLCADSPDVQAHNVDQGLAVGWLSLHYSTFGLG